MLFSAHNDASGDPWWQTFISIDIFNMHEMFYCMWNYYDIYKGFVKETGLLQLNNQHLLGFATAS